MSTLTRWLVLVPLLTGCAGGDGRAGDEEAAIPAHVQVETAVAQVKPFVIRVEALGEVAARPGRLAELAAPAESRVSAIYVEPGQRVRAGDPLVAFDRDVWDAAALQAEAAAAAARQARDRARRLASEGILPRSEAEQAAAEAAAAEAALVAARRRQRLAVLRSPIDGVVASMDAALEANGDPTLLLVRVVDPSALEGLFRLTAADAARVQPGAEVQGAAAAAAAGPLAAGVVRAVSPALDPATGTVAVRVNLASVARALRLGEALTGRLAVGVRDAAVVVPVSALVPGDRGEQVYAVDAGGTARARPVVVGGRSATEAEIIQGLEGGEVVVTAGAYGVSDGAQVQTASAP
ncbi:MAG: efflux RND transporter periplasmic adaptor subunit [Gemmatimonadota bacterium]